MSCVRTVLSRSPVGCVERCTCGAVHLSIGALSLRLDPTVARVLADASHDVGRARPRLTHGQPSPATQIGEGCPASAGQHFAPPKNAAHASHGHASQPSAGA